MFLHLRIKQIMFVFLNDQILFPLDKLFPVFVLKLQPYGQTQERY